MPDFLLAPGLAFAFALVLTPIIRDIFHAYNVVDRPGFRKVHAYPIPRLGGIAIAIAYTIALTWLANKSGANSVFSSGMDDFLWRLLPGASVVLLTGLLDDFFDIRASFKLAGQCAAASIAFASGMRIEAISGVPLPFAVSFLLTVFWLLLAMNSFNLIDGLDGLCAGVSFVSVVALFAVGRVQHNAPLQQLTLPLLGALVGFLCYNFSRATMFLGDAGSLSLGFLAGCAGLLAVKPEATLGAAVPLMAIAVPIADVSLSVVRRLLNHRPIFAADRGHIHHRLLDRGYSARRVVLILYLWSAAGASAAFVVANPAWRRWHSWVLLAFCVAAAMGIRELRYSEFTMAVRKFFRTEAMRVVEPVGTLAAALEQSNSEDEWWVLLVAAARDAGWNDLLWIRGHTVWRKQVFTSDPPPGWSFSLTLSEGDSLQIHGPVNQARGPIEILAFADAVHRSFAAGRAASDRPDVS
jgi:UDP-GlcNAc:undecaprenyl-phosphate GlcNAc-1-phosphate transferase